MELESRYPLGCIVRDYARAAAGILAVVTPLLVLELPFWLGVILWLLAGLFGLFALHTFQRQILVFRLDEHGISSHRPSWLPGRWLVSAGLFGSRAIAWSRLHSLTLSYYSLRRDQQRGWMELHLKGTDQQAQLQSLRLDSYLDGFDRALARAASAAFDKALVLSPATIENLNACGLLLLEKKWQ